jgi:glycosyltransferase involved in cell wall biosynthesis
VTVDRLRIAVVVPFLDEATHLGELLDSLAGQTRRPDRLLLVDDGSRDGSTAIATRFAREHRWARVARRRPQRRSRDRLAGGTAAAAFAWGAEQLGTSWDVVAKLDADLRLPTSTIATVERCLEERPALGIAGPRLRVTAAPGTPPHRCPPDHVDGAAKFYRRACWEQIAPFPQLLGWDTIDEVRARLRGWEVRSTALPGGGPLQLRSMGRHDGLLRGYRRWGRCAWGFGEHPLHLLAVAVQRAGDPPAVLGSLNYLWGWTSAALRRAPRAEPEVRAFVRRDQLQRLRRRALGRATRPSLAEGGA